LANDETVTPLNQTFSEPRTDIHGITSCAVYKAWIEDVYLAVIHSVTAAPYTHKNIKPTLFLKFLQICAPGNAKETSTEAAGITSSAITLEKPMTVGDPIAS
jgi:hypothetical protein